MQICGRIILAMTVVGTALKSAPGPARPGTICRAK